MKTIILSIALLARFTFAFDGSKVDWNKVANAFKAETLIGGVPASQYQAPPARSHQEQHHDNVMRWEMEKQTKHLKCQSEQMNLLLCLRKKERGQISYCPELSWDCR